MKLAYIVAVYARVCCANTLGGLKIMCLKHGADRDKLKYVVRRTWLFKGLTIEFECISMKMYEVNYRI